MRRAAPALAAVGLVTALGCGGALHSDIYGDIYGEIALDLEQGVPASDPNYAAAQAAIEDAWIAAWEGDAGFMDAVSLGMAVDDAVLDGALDAGEVALLRDRTAEWRARTVDPARRAELVLIKQAVEQRLRRERGMPPPVTVVAGPHEALVQLGFEDVACTDEQRPGRRETRCSGWRDGALVTVVDEVHDDPSAAVALEAPKGGAVRQDGARVVQVGLQLREVADGLSAVLAPPGTPLDRVGADELRARAAAAGWQGACREDALGDERVLTCELELGGRPATVDLRASSGGDLRSDQGVARRIEGGRVLSVVVDDPEQAAQVADSLVR